MELYSILGKGSEDADIGISTDNYVEGTCLLPFDVTLTSAGKTGGNCRMELQFCNPLHNDHNLCKIFQWSCKKTTVKK